MQSINIKIFKICMKLLLKKHQKLTPIVKTNQKEYRKYEQRSSHT